MPNSDKLRYYDAIASSAAFRAAFDPFFESLFEPLFEPLCRLLFEPLFEPRPRLEIRPALDDSIIFHSCLDCGFWELFQGSLRGPGRGPGPRQ